MSNKAVLKMENIIKRFPGTVALKGVDFELKKGEIRGLLGKNGAGKSTIVKILAGLEKETKGDIYFFGRRVNINNVQDSEGMGFRFVSQEPVLMEDLSVAENLAFREKDLKEPFGIVNWKGIYQKAGEKLTTFGFELDPKLEVKYLTTSEKQILLTLREIFSTGAKIIALDEVTTSLSTAEREKLYKILRHEAQNGKSFIYISHEIDEIFSICNVVTVLKNGKVVLKDKVKNVKTYDLKKAIVGEEIREASVGDHRRSEEKILSVKNVSNEKLTELSFDLHKDEILGVYGLRGSGRTELLETIFGLLPVKKGRIIYQGKGIENDIPSQLISKGIGLVGEDRDKGLFFIRPLSENIVISSLKKLCGKFGLFIRKGKEREMAKDSVRKLDIDAFSLMTEVTYLSGGNKQKVMIGRCLAANSNLYLFDEVSKGIDVEAKEEIYKIIKDLASCGRSVIFTTSDIDEMVRVPDRVMILYKGRIMQIVSREEVTKEKLLKYANGEIDTERNN